MNEYYTRQLRLPRDKSETFFLWGPRQTGKSTLLKETFPNDFYIDLLHPVEFRRYLERPELLIEEVELKNLNFAVIDEIQKIPALLDTVQWLHENRRTNFSLCGSSARKVKRGRANLLGGRGLTYKLSGFSAIELCDDFDLQRMLNNGYIPRMYLSDKPKALLNTYVSQYLKEEIAAEGLVRRLPAFSEFLNAASFSDCEIVSFSNIARETGVSSPTIRGYFDILVDTLLGRFLQAYRRRPKRRTVQSPKFYFSDVGVVNFLARRGTILPKSELFGKAFENWVFHELCAYNSYREVYAQFNYWRLSTGVEVDFLVNHFECAIEAKGIPKISAHHLKGLRELKKDYPETKERIVVSLDEKDRITADGIKLLSYNTFLEQLWGGKLF